jgi:hypothetical protein
VYHKRGILSIPPIGGSVALSCQENDKMRLSHLSLENCTPAEAAKIKSPYKKWGDVVGKTGGIL